MIDVITIDKRSRPKIRLTMLKPLSPRVMTVAIVPGPAVLGIASGMTAGFLPCVSMIGLGRAMMMPQATFPTTRAPAILNASMSI